MVDHPDTQGQQPQQGKLVLPTYSGEERRMYASPQTIQVRPDQLIHQTTTPAPKHPLVKLGYFWRKDPAYKVLIIATGMVLVAGILFMTLVSSAIIRNPNLFAQNGTISQNPPTGVNPAGTVDLRPTFPTPGGGQGSNSSSQPPAQSTPALQPTESATATPQPSPGSGGTLTIQIVSIPQQVINGSTVPVEVMASEAGASVRLQVLYDAAPYYYTSGSQTTDGSGNATLSWHVHVTGFKAKGVVARVVAVATDQNGQQAVSQAVTVQVIMLGG